MKNASYYLPFLRLSSWPLFQVLLLLAAGAGFAPGPALARTAGANGIPMGHQLPRARRPRPQCW